LAAACIARGHLFEAIVALFFPPAGLIGLARMATPGSLWARRLYSERKLAASERRYGSRDPDTLTWLGIRFHRLRGRGFLIWRGPYWQARLVISMVLVALLVADLIDGRPGWLTFAVAMLLIFAIGLRAFPTVRHGSRRAATARGEHEDAPEVAADAALGGPLGGPDASG